MEVNITKRIDTPDGRRFCRVIFTLNGRIKPDCPQAGVDLRAVMTWMGQTNLESITRYLKPARNKTVRKRSMRTLLPRSGRNFSLSAGPHKYHRCYRSEIHKLESSLQHRGQ